jgi:hypothetical protein
MMEHGFAPGVTWRQVKQPIKILYKQKLFINGKEARNTISSVMMVSLER